jgi:hypothetical protein
MRRLSDDTDTPAVPNSHVEGCAFRRRHQS